MSSILRASACVMLATLLACANPFSRRTHTERIPKPGDRLTGTLEIEFTDKQDQGYVEEIRVWLDDRLVVEPVDARKVVIERVAAGSVKVRVKAGDFSDSGIDETTTLNVSAGEVAYWSLRAPQESFLFWGGTIAGVVAVLAVIAALFGSGA